MKFNERNLFAKIAPISNIQHKHSFRKKIISRDLYYGQCLNIHLKFNWSTKGDGLITNTVKPV